MGTHSPGRPSDGATLVVGATGILRPAVVSLVSGGAAVVGVARDPRALDALSAELAGRSGRFVALAHDASSPDLPAALADLTSGGGLEYETALVYSPATTSGVVAALSELCRGTVVEILTSDSARPSTGRAWSLADVADPSLRRRRLVLGWRRDGDSSSWHSPAEVSAAALETMTRPGDRLLGVVSPWDDRPA